MLLTESYKNRLLKLAGLKTSGNLILKEVEDLYANSGKRIKFDVNIMKMAIEGGLEVGLIFQSNNDKYKMPIWKMRIIHPVAMGYSKPTKNKKSELVVRGVHVVGASEKKAIETKKRSAEAHNEWRLFKVSNIKSMFLTGNKFEEISLAGYNPNDSAMSSVIAFFEPGKASDYQNTLSPVKPDAPVGPVQEPIVKPKKEPVVKAPSIPNKQEKDLASKLDKLNKLV